jgi:hypothetical protein
MKNLKKEIRWIFKKRNYDFKKFNQELKNYIKYMDKRVNLEQSIDWVYGWCLLTKQRGVRAILRLDNQA